MIRVQCPGCKLTLTVDDSKAGATGTCPKCKSKIQVPKKGAAPARPAPKPAAPAPPPRQPAPQPAPVEPGILGDLSDLKLDDDQPPKEKPKPAAPKSNPPARGIPGNIPNLSLDDESKPGSKSTPRPAGRKPGTIPVEDEEVVVLEPIEEEVRPPKATLPSKRPPQPKTKAPEVVEEIEVIEDLELVEDEKPKPRPKPAPVPKPLPTQKPAAPVEVIEIVEAIEEVADVHEVNAVEEVVEVVEEGTAGEEILDVVEEAPMPGPMFPPPMPGRNVGGGEVVDLSQYVAVNPDDEDEDADYPRGKGPRRRARRGESNLTNIIAGSAFIVVGIAIAVVAILLAPDDKKALAITFGCVAGVGLTGWGVFQFFR